MCLSEAKQGQWMSWESVEKKKLCCGEVSGMDADGIRFMLEATYDVLLSPQNLSKCIGEDPTGPLCSGIASLSPFLSACKIKLVSRAIHNT